MSRSVTAFAPGRVNLIGEHTDYNDGLALPFAIAEGVTVRARAIAGRSLVVRALDLAAQDSFDPADPKPVEGWRAFARGAAAELSKAGVHVPPALLEISGNVPQGSGLSSSAALEVALVLALRALAESPAPDQLELAWMCSRIENEWVGACTGLLDQLASLYGEPGHALRIDFRSLEIEPVALELGAYQLVTLDSGEPRGNAASGYNRRRAECARACELLPISSLRDATLELAASLPDPLCRRVRHVVNANARVEQAIAALRRGDLPGLGRLLDAAHGSLRDDYEVSTPAVEATVDRLKRAGALGARLIGGGFGGHVLALLPADAPPPAGALQVRPEGAARVLAE